MAKIIKGPETLLFPLPVVLVSARGKPPLKDNLITIAWAGIICSEPAMLSISVRPSRYSYGIIKDTKEFGVNIPSVRLAKEVDYCGVTSGKDTDKFTACKFTKFEARSIKAPLVKECPVNIECKVINRTTVGDHDLFLGEVVFVHADEDKIDERGSIITEKLDMLIYITGQYWSVGKYLGKLGFTRKTGD